MSSARDRQRAAARAKLEREMAQRAAAAQRKRQLRTRIAAGAGGALAVVLVAWLVVGLSKGDDSKAAATAPTSSAAPAACAWLPMVDPSASPTPALPKEIKNVGTPPTDVPRSGYQVMTIATNLGTVKVEMDLAKAPCTAASFAYLSGKKFFDKSSCHRLAQTIFALQCGDPSGTGLGGPAYKFADEYLPTDSRPVYHEGDVAMANGGQDNPNTNGSQFFFIYKNVDSELSASYTLFGHVIQGMDIVKKVAAGGDDGAFAQEAGGGHPKVKLTFKSVTVGPVTATPATTTPAANASASAAS